MKKNNTPVLQDWVLGLDWKSQTALISSIRGLDSEDASTALTAKIITKMIRYAILNNADKKTGFMSSSAVKASEVKMMLAKLKIKASKHWYDHIIKAIELIGAHNPNGYISSYWTSVLNLDITKPYYSCTDIPDDSSNASLNISRIADVLSEVKESVYDLKNDMTELSSIGKHICIPFNCVTDVDKFINLTKDQNDLTSYRYVLLLLQGYLNAIKDGFPNIPVYRDKPDEILLRDYTKIQLSPSSHDRYGFIASSGGKPLAYVRIIVDTQPIMNELDYKPNRYISIAELTPDDIIAYPMYEVYFKDNLATTYRVDNSKLNGISKL